MVKHSFFKNIKPVLAEAQERAFAGLEPVSRLRPTRFELPITSIRRVMGDNFYKLEDTKDDVIHLLINDTGSFNLESISTNFEQAREMIQSLISVFNTFIELNGKNMTMSKDFCAQKLVKLTVTSEKKGPYSTLVSMNDLNFMAEFDAEQNVCGVKNLAGISELSQKVYENDEQYKKMQVAGNMKAMAEFDAERAELLKQMNNLQLELISGFYNFVKEYGRVDDVTDVYDVQFLFSKEYNSEDNKTLHDSLIISIHDAASLNVKAIRQKFNLDLEPSLDPEYKDNE